MGDVLGTLGSSDASDAVNLLGDVFGSTQSTSGTTTGTSRATSSEQLKLDQAAIAKIIEDVLGGAGGLADIFGGEQRVGLFDSSVSNEASGDLVAKLVGELAKLTGERVTIQEGSQESTTEKKAEDEGILSGIGDFFGF